MTLASKPLISNQAISRMFFTSESVTCGHPDKLADQISDAILDAILQRDQQARVAVETLVTRGLALVAGEISTQTYVEIPEIVRQVIREAGYGLSEENFQAANIAVLTAISGQSPDIAQGVLRRKKIGAGDQGLMVGYACNETPELMPLPIMLAHKLVNKLTEVRKTGEVDFLRPDGKSQVSVEYTSSYQPRRVSAVVLSSQHTAKVKLNVLQKTLQEKVIKPVLGGFLSRHTKIFINPTGRFVQGGPPADTGLTGRKIIVDTYGGLARHGGGAFSGKDPTKVDRSGHYAARWVAKNVVAAGLAERVEVQVAYAIGYTEPVAVNVETFGTAKVEPAKISAAVKQVFDLSPGAIIQTLNLRRPIYLPTAVGGHFGRPEFTWEKTNRIQALKRGAFK